LERAPELRARTEGLLDAPWRRASRMGAPGSREDRGKQTCEVCLLLYH
jgi:hypothetical protein